MEIKIWEAKHNLHIYPSSLKANPHTSSLSRPFFSLFSSTPSRVFFLSFISPHVTYFGFVLVLLPKHVGSVSNQSL
ncbi:unnamed protein product [Brassica oleracea var. botrytis]